MPGALWLDLFSAAFEQDYLIKLFSIRAETLVPRCQHDAALGSGASSRSHLGQMPAGVV